MNFQTTQFGACGDCPPPGCDEENRVQEDRQVEDARRIETSFNKELINKPVQNDGNRQAGEPDLPSRG